MVIVKVRRLPMECMTTHAYTLGECEQALMDYGPMAFNRADLPAIYQTPRVHVNNMSFKL